MKDDVLSISTNATQSKLRNGDHQLAIGIIESMEEVE